MQCDIDILGDATNMAEIELILATTTLLSKIGFHGFTVHINDRRILKAMAAYSGFKEVDYDEVFIILDKMDKIGPDGVAKAKDDMRKELDDAVVEMRQTIADFFDVDEFGGIMPAEYPNFSNQFELDDNGAIMPTGQIVLQYVFIITIQMVNNNIFK